MVLEHHAHMAAKIGNQARRDLVEVLPADQHLPLIGPLHQHDELEQGTFARARVPGQKHHLTPLDVQVDLIEGFKASGVAFTDVVENDHLLAIDRKSTRLNSSHVKISYAVFCLKKKST